MGHGIAGPAVAAATAPIVGIRSLPVAHIVEVQGDLIDRAARLVLTVGEPAGGVVVQRGIHILRDHQVGSLRTACGAVVELHRHHSRGDLHNVQVIFALHLVHGDTGPVGTTGNAPVVGAGAAPTGSVTEVHPLSRRLIGIGVAGALTVDGPGTILVHIAVAGDHEVVGLLSLGALGDAVVEDHHVGIGGDHEGIQGIGTLHLGHGDTGPGVGTGEAGSPIVDVHVLPLGVGVVIVDRTGAIALDLGAVAQSHGAVAIVDQMEGQLHTCGDVHLVSRDLVTVGLGVVQHQGGGVGIVTVGPILVAAVIPNHHIAVLFEGDGQLTILEDESVLGIIGAVDVAHQVVGGLSHITDGADAIVEGVANIHVTGGAMAGAVVMGVGTGGSGAGELGDHRQTLDQLLTGSSLLEDLHHEGSGIGGVGTADDLKAGTGEGEGSLLVGIADHQLSQGLAAHLHVAAMLIGGILAVGDILLHALGQGAGALTVMGELALSGVVVGDVHEVVLVVHHGSRQDGDLLVHLDLGLDVHIGGAGGILGGAHTGGGVVDLVAGLAGAHGVLLMDADRQPQLIGLVHELLGGEPQLGAHGVVTVHVDDLITGLGHGGVHIVAAIAQIIVEISAFLHLGRRSGGEVDTVDVAQLVSIGGIGAQIGGLRGADAHELGLRKGLVAQQLGGQELIVLEQQAAGVQLFGAQTVVQDVGLVLSLGHIEGDRDGDGQGGVGLISQLHIEHMLAGVVIEDLQHLIGFVPLDLIIVHQRHGDVSGLGHVVDIAVVEDDILRVGGDIVLIDSLLVAVHTSNAHLHAGPGHHIVVGVGPVVDIDRVGLGGGPVVVVLVVDGTLACLGRQGTAGEGVPAAIIIVVVGDADLVAVLVHDLHVEVFDTGRVDVLHSALLIAQNGVLDLGGSHHISPEVGQRQVDGMACPLVVHRIAGAVDRVGSVVLDGHGTGQGLVGRGIDGVVEHHGLLLFLRQGIVDAGHLHSAVPPQACAVE